MAGPKSQSKSLPTLAVEFKDMVVAYAKQEVAEPLKGVLRFVGYGIAGSVLLSLGLVLLVLGLLRALQTEAAATFDGNWSFAPYLITLVACAIVIAMAIRAIGKARRRAEENAR